MCSACGLHEKQGRFGPLVLSREGLDSDYYAWYSRQVGVHHEHDWVRAGCHSRSAPLLPAILACSPDYDRDGLLSWIPAIPEEARAKAAADKLLEMSADERKQELRQSTEVDPRLNGLWISKMFQYANGGDPLLERMVSKEHRKAYAAWWHAHPKWQAIFAKPREEQ